MINQKALNCELGMFAMYRSIDLFIKIQLGIDHKTSFF